MSVRGVRIGLLCLIGGAAAAGPVVGYWSPTRAVASGSPARPVLEPEPVPSATPFAEQAAAAARRAPFQRSRVPRPVSYDPEVHEARDAVEQDAAEPAAPKPTLQLAGIVWGDRPVAVLEGLPALDRPTVLAQGDSTAGIKVRRIERNRVLLTGFDTTWALSVKEPWR